MSLNKYVPDPGGQISQPKNASPDYSSLVRYLLEPFLDTPESLSLDCEMSQDQARIWIRLAFEGSDKGRVFGRGGRNIQAIRTVIEAFAQAAGQSVHLDIYGGTPTQNRESGSESRGVVKKSGDRQVSNHKPPVKTRPRQPFS